MIVNLRISKTILVVLGKIPMLTSKKDRGGKITVYDLMRKTGEFEEERKQYSWIARRKAELEGPEWLSKEISKGYLARSKDLRIHKQSGMMRGQRRFGKWEEDWRDKSDTELEISLRHKGFQALKRHEAGPTDGVEVTGGEGDFRRDKLDRPLSNYDGDGQIEVNLTKRIDLEKKTNEGMRGLMIDEI
ncbi:hypothetical protein PPACK8108_LOCUS8472 [Phakopsora pachyrhizi]|uniref:Uncharacterized protein n=1 Tax=Phakopsora pachyrhizi TaxID=170000 RepID=A0AAV0AUS5_PHAPC|nr:hypothetical protein PPACK8108_LOCUS8472 [Phakopsora pachyrhizi]